MKNVARKVCIMAAVVSLGLAWVGSLPNAGASSTTDIHRALTKSGSLLWNFESLLRARFGSGTPAATYPLNFDCAGSKCSPTSKYIYFEYTFTDLGKSSFRMAGKYSSKMFFGVDPEAVQIYGHLIYCSTGNTKYLVRLADTLSLTLKCYAPLPST